MGPPFRPVVCRREAEHVGQLPGPARGGWPGRPHRLLLGGGAGRHPGDHLRRSTGRGLSVRQRPDWAGLGAWRPGRHLHADDPRTTGGHAGLHPYRGSPQRGLWRFLPRLHRGSLRGRRGPAGHHRRCRLPPWRAVGPEGQRGRRPRIRRPVGGTRGGRQQVRHRGDDGRGPRPLVARPDGRGLKRLSGRTYGLRAVAVPAVHVRDHGQAQGHHAHHRRLPDPGGLHPPDGLRHPGRRGRLLVCGRHRLGNRAQLHRLRPAG